MRMRTLGRTNLKVSELGLGGLFVATRFTTDFSGSAAVIHRALDLGINYLDTAPGYHDSEEAIGRSLADDKRPVVLSTKLGGRPKPFLPQDRDCLTRSVEERLRLLGRDAIDVLMIHEADRPGQYDWWTDWETVRGPVLDVLDDLKARGLIRFTGLGGTTAYELAHLMRSGRFDVVLTAFNYSLLWREAAVEILPAARELGMGVIVGSPLQQGALSRRFDDQIERGAAWLSKPRREQFRALYRYLDEIGMPVAEAALRFVLSNADVHCMLMGARSVREVEENVAAVEKGPLPPEVLKRLDEIAALVPFRPFCEPFGLGWLLIAGGGWKGPGVAA